MAASSILSVFANGFAQPDKLEQKRDRHLLGASALRMAGSWYLWAAMVLLCFKTQTLHQMLDKVAPTDFLSIYYGAKLIGHVDIYDRDAYNKAVVQDPEFAGILPLPANFKQWAPAPPPIYPPASFWMLKPLTWLGYHRAAAFHFWLMPFFGILAAWGLGLCAALLVGKASAAPRAAVGYMAFLLVVHMYNTILYLGQLNLMVAAGMLGSLALASAFPVLSAILLVVTIVLKPTGWLMALPVLWLWRSRPAAWTVLVLLGGILFLLPGIAGWQAYFTSLKTGILHFWVMEHAQSRAAPNQAIGVIAQLIEGPAVRVLLFKTVSTTVYTLAFLLPFVGFFLRQISIYTASAAAMLLSFVVGPVSWEEHTIFMLPFAMLASLATESMYSQAGVSAERGRWQAWGTPLVAAMFGFSIINWPPGAAARLNVLVSKPWHVLAATVLISQGCATAYLLWQRRKVLKFTI